MNVIKMSDLDLAGKRVLIRQDLNVPIMGGKITSDKRIKASLPTIELARKAGAKVMVMSQASQLQYRKTTKVFKKVGWVTFTLKSKVP